MPYVAGLLSPLLELYPLLHGRQSEFLIASSCLAHTVPFASLRRNTTTCASNLARSLSLSPSLGSTDTAEPRSVTGQGARTGMPPSCCPCVASAPLAYVNRACRIDEKPNFAIRFLLPVSKALTRRVSLRVSTDPTRRTVCGVSSLPSLPTFLVPFAPLAPSPRSLHAQHNTSRRTGGGKRDICRALLSKRPIQTLARSLADCRPTSRNNHEAARSNMALARRRRPSLESIYEIMRLASLP